MTTADSEIDPTRGPTAELGSLANSPMTRLRASAAAHDCRVGRGGPLVEVSGPTR
jgi:hypothetical protein